MGFVDRAHMWLPIALIVLALLLLVSLAGLAGWRAIDEVRFLRRQRLIARYRPVADSLLTPAHTADAEADVLQRLSAIPRRHRPIVADILLAALRLTTGELVPRLREAARTLGLLDRWTSALTDGRWWIRAEAARALGLMRDPASVDRLLAVLDEPNEEVRAAAVDALGRIGDPRCASALLARLRDESRHQRTRLVEAIRGLGPSVMPVLLAHAHEPHADATVVADLVGMVGGTAAIDSLLEWSSSDVVGLRAAALRAIGSIGLDDRSYFFALRHLDDDDVEVRAMAARALGRSGRQDAVPYLSRHLDDVWVVAAHCATGLRRLGSRGAAALQTRAETDGAGADLARQMLWELAFLKGAA
jgi:HEAT repeat protein